MKNVITTKDLDSLNHLMVFEQWASTKFRTLEELTDEPKLKTMFKDICLKHGDRFDACYDYITANSDKGGKQ